jgi:hypothetical protein
MRGVRVYGVLDVNVRRAIMGDLSKLIEITSAEALAAGQIAALRIAHAADALYPPLLLTRQGNTRARLFN